MLATTIGLVACVLVTCVLALDWIRHPGDDGLDPSAAPPHRPARTPRRILRAHAKTPGSERGNEPRPTRSRGDRSVLT